MSNEPTQSDSTEDDTTGAACEIDRVTGTATPHRTVEASAMLADHTTFHLGGPADRIIVATSEAELVAAVVEADQAGTPLLVLSGGSNVLVADSGFPGTVVKVATRGVTADVSNCGGAVVTVQAGEDWDDFVAFCIMRGWIGVETLSGIPGMVGSTPIQNVGAYGCEVSQTIARVKTFDRSTGQVKSFAASDCGFAYRSSIFKQEPGRYVVLSVTFQFELGDLSMPIRYAELATALAVEQGERAPMNQVREAVLSIRASKGMVLDEDDHDTWSAGSFFTNPIITEGQAAELPEKAPRFPQGNGMVKTSAAWLIDNAGFGKGYGAGQARLSSKHALALTNRGSATTAEMLELAREIRLGVEKAYGITLVPEPVLVNCSL